MKTEEGHTMGNTSTPLTQSRCVNTFTNTSANTSANTSTPLTQNRCVNTSTNTFTNTSANTSANTYSKQVCKMHFRKDIFLTKENIS